MARPLAVLVWTVAIGIPVAYALLVLLVPPPDQDAWAFPLYGGIVATWGLVGAFLATKQPGNRVGWVLLVGGLLMGLALLGQTWSLYSLWVWEGTLPGTVAGALVGVLFFPALYVAMLIPFLFPDGRFLSRRWAAVGGLVIAVAAATLAATLVRPGPLEGMGAIDNPLVVPQLAGPAQAVLDAGGVVTLLFIPAGILATILRYRRGGPLERKQVQWFGSVIVLSFSMFFAATVLPQPYGQWAWIVASLSLGLIPVAIGIAILRYRLYEIDRIVSRTIGWALVTGLLVAVLAGTIVALQALLAPFTNNNTLAVAGSTLVAAALFQPLRARVQRAVDRRFNRARVDAQRAIDAFGTHLRDDVDIDALNGRLLAAAAATVQPNAAGLWIRRTGA